MRDYRSEVCAANVALGSSGLVVLTWGNISQIDRESGRIFIKPSGVDYTLLKPQMICAVNADGSCEGDLRPSSDLPTHKYLYERFPSVGAIVHTHSVYATAWAQAGRAIPPLGTTHADAFFGPVPCTAPLTKEQIEGDYEMQTGVSIAEVADPQKIPAVLVNGHGVFCFGKDAAAALENAVTLEQVAKMALLTLTLNPDSPDLPQTLLQRHYNRKHGANAYYGQK